MLGSLKSLVKKNKPLFFLWSKLDLAKSKYLISKDIKAYMNKFYKSVFGRNINWENPTCLIEKIYWLQINSDTSLWTKCSDKYLVREYVKEKGSKEILNILYGKWERAEDINWDSLPESFVIKTNNSCGQVILVDNKNDLNKEKAVKQLNFWLDMKYGYKGGQLHYTRIQPCIIAEKLFKNTIDKSKSLVDYKVWCFHGVPECVLVVFNRTNDNYSLSSYDLDWNNISDKTFKPDSKHYSGEDIPKPKSLSKMLEHAKKLSEGIPQVRIDFYDIDDEPIFGEMTFTTGYGYYNDDYYSYLGSKIDLSEIKKIE